MPPEEVNKPKQRLPKVSILVPLFRETEIAHALIARLTRLTYPKCLLDVILVMEEEDETTRKTLAAIDLPPWIRPVIVPDGSPRTKPRAMNYALDFCQGDIIGIFDAEDAPDPDQITIVARRFQTAPPDVVCLQGVLDYYNPRQNWLARCFTIEYATWFRLMLPGLARLGFAIPLGGTTLYFRRDVLEELGGWDAHNVTEDADLGFRSGAPRLPDRDDRHRDRGRSELPALALDQAAFTLAQGVHDDLSGAYAAAGIALSAIRRVEIPGASRRIS